MKRFLIAVLSLLLLFSFFVPAFAFEPISDSIKPNQIIVAEKDNGYYLLSCLNYRFNCGDYSTKKTLLLLTKIDPALYPPSNHYPEALAYLCLHIKEIRALQMQGYYLTVASEQKKVDERVVTNQPYQGDLLRHCRVECFYEVKGTEDGARIVMNIF